ncbi:GTPase HflX [uncultured Cytophaga sp.]|uniref:GTPase HflX n=1 Tax=uncultured Cytophaga sp. TaxID=160238 RepID=UPI0026041B38|nr:GTPase HflX [uncultured Cytophaga sp.]
MQEETGFSTQKTADRAILIGLSHRHQPQEKTIEYLDELDFLARTAGLEVVYRFMQKLDRPDIRTYVGKGKLADIKAYILEHSIPVIIFDDDLSPSQLRNLETELACKIYDRSLLILDIFSLRAQTAQSRAQVELARLQYLLPRLTRMWTHLERQRGGTGTRGGSGEKEIETDRRIIRDQITLLKSRLEKINKQSETQRKSREGIVRVALVGYTNVGKSTLMQRLSKSDVFAENKLFATVDSTVRKVVLNEIPFLLTDTVGFIRKLPHGLIESFKSTLDEVREADILLHVIDLPHASYEEHMQVVQSTLAEIKANDKITILVFNKVDAYLENIKDNPDALSLQDIDKMYTGSANENRVFISATQNLNLDKLRAILVEKVTTVHCTIYPNYLVKDQY